MRPIAKRDSASGAIVTHCALELTSHGKLLIPKRRSVAEREGFEPSVEFPLHTLSKRAPSTTRTSLRLESTICERSEIVYRKTLLQVVRFLKEFLIERLTDGGVDTRRTNCVRPLNVLRSLTAVWKSCTHFCACSSSLGNARPLTRCRWHLPSLAFQSRSSSD